MLYFDISVFVDLIHALISAGSPNENAKKKERFERSFLFHSF
jgi:hypothetical protein